MDTAIVVRVGERTFRPVAQVTYRQRLYVRRLVLAAHLDELPEADGLRGVLARITTAGSAPELLAAWLTEDGKPWTEPAAAANAAFFAEVTDPVAMDALDAALVPLLVGFFNGKPSWPATSASSSAVASPDSAEGTSISATTPPQTSETA